MKKRKPVGVRKHIFIFTLWSPRSHRFVQLPESDPVAVVDPGEEVVEEGALPRPQHAP
jgi:hypothetical protein